MRSGTVAASVAAAACLLGAPDARAAILYYSTNQGTALVETNQNGRLEASGCLIGCPMLDLHLGTPSMTTGSATARLSAFMAFAEALGGPNASAQASANGVLEFFVSGSDATWTGTTTGRSSSAQLTNLATGGGALIHYNVEPVVVRLLDGHQYRMTLGAGGNAAGGFYPGGSVRLTFGNATFVDVPEPATLSLMLLSLAALVLASGAQRTLLAPALPMSPTSVPA